jgi:hypothetical protein
MHIGTAIKARNDASELNIFTAETAPSGGNDQNRIDHQEKEQANNDHSKSIPTKKSKIK